MTAHNRPSSGNKLVNHTAATSISGGATLCLPYSLNRMENQPVADSAERVAELRENFTECDENGDGRIQYDEFVTLLNNIGAQTNEQENRLGFDEVDTDKDGSISFDEFVAWFSES